MLDPANSLLSPREIPDSIPDPFVLEDPTYPLLVESGVEGNCLDFADASGVAQPYGTPLFAGGFQVRKAGASTWMLSGRQWGMTRLP